MTIIQEIVNFFRPQSYVLKKLTAIFIVQNMITHPFFMFCLIMFLGNLGACKCLDYQGLSCILARARLCRNLALLIIHGERVIYTGQFDRSFVPWISVREQRECTIPFSENYSKKLRYFIRI